MVSEHCPVQLGERQRQATRCASVAPGVHHFGGARVSRCFLQAEDGIRDLTVTGVQTCALPIFQPRECSCASCLTREHPSDNQTRTGRSDPPKLRVTGTRRAWSCTSLQVLRTFFERFRDRKSVV